MKQTLTGRVSWILGVATLVTSGIITFIEIALHADQYGGGGGEAESLMLMAIVAVQVSVFVSLWFLFRRLLIQPARVLLESMRRVASGQLSERVKLDSPREFGLLGDQFNTMVDELQQARARIDAYYAESMARVDRLATVGELATAMSHEIHNPLAGLSGALQILRTDEGLQGHREVFEEMYATVERLSKVTTDLLSFGRPSEPVLAAHDANDCVRSVLFFVEQQARSQRAVEIVVDLEERLPAILVDAQQLQQVLLNVCINALQAMPDGGRLVARTRLAEGREPPMVSITVADDGVGIQPSEMEAIFEPFHTTKHRGTGLGLTISKRLMEGLGGQIVLRSEVGVGTTVELLARLAGQGD